MLVVHIVQYFIIKQPVHCHKIILKVLHENNRTSMMNACTVKDNIGLQQRIAQNNRYLLKELKLCAQNQYLSWKIKIPFCTKTLISISLAANRRLRYQALAKM